jgi:hypothetical protein
MAVLKVENFGGIQPAVSPRALSPNAAQINDGLLTATTEFRPLAEDSTNGVTSPAPVALAKTLFRLDSTTSFLVAEGDISYTRSQNHGDETKRTFYVDNSANPVAALRQYDTSAVDRLLGVPVPAAPAVSTPTVTILSAELLADKVRIAILNSAVDVEPNLRFSGNTIYGGPLENPGLLFPNAEATLPAAVTTAPEYSSLFAKVSDARSTELALLPAKLGAKHIGTAADADFATYGSYTYIPIAALPYTFQQNGTPLATSLPAIVNPRTSAQALSGELVTKYTGLITSEFDTELNAYALRVELTDVIKEFYRLLYVYDPSAVVIPGEDTATDPTGPAPMRPTGAYNENEPGNDWETYFVNIDEYYANLQIYANNLAAVDSDKRSVTERVAELQADALRIVREIEAIQLAAWRKLAQDTKWAADIIYADVVTDLIPAVDKPRVIETRFYTVTFVTDWDEESAPALPSTQQDVDQYTSTTITRPAVPPDRNITKWRIYRSATSALTTTFQFVAELQADVDSITVEGQSFTQTSYVDIVSNEALGEVLPTLDWAAPVTGLKGLVGLPNGIIAAHKGSTIHFCEPYVPYAWPTSYQLTTEFPIVGLGVFGQTMFVGTTASPYFVSGSDSASMSAIKLDSNQACASRRSIATVQGGVLYASPDGLCMASNSGVQLVTQGLFSRADWQALNPDTMFAVEHENIYYLFYNYTPQGGSLTTGCYAFDATSKKLSTIVDLADVTAVFVERETDEMFSYNGTAVKKLFAATTKRTSVWKSAKITLPMQSGFAWLKVYGDQTEGVPATIKWYGDDIEHTITVDSTAPVRLPAGRYLEHEIEVTSKARITKVILAGTTQELQGV